MRGTQFAELSAFVAVAEEASFTKAAKRLGLSTATLSQTVRRAPRRAARRFRAAAHARILYVLSEPVAEPGRFAGAHRVSAREPAQQSSVISDQKALSDH